MSKYTRPAQPGIRGSGIMGNTGWQLIIVKEFMESKII
jgi:hypothetical protein